MACSDENDNADLQNDNNIDSIADSIEFGCQTDNICHELSPLKVIGSRVDIHVSHIPDNHSKRFDAIDKFHLIDASENEASITRIDDLLVAVESLESVGKYAENDEIIASENIHVDRSFKADHINDEFLVQLIADDKSVVVENTQSDESSKAEHTDNNVLLESIPDDKYFEVDNTQTDLSSREEHSDDNGVVEEQSHITVDDGDSSFHFDPYIDIKAAMSLNKSEGLIKSLERQNINWSLLGEHECLFYNLKQLYFDERNRAINIKGDGACLFRSISLAI